MASERSSSALPHVGETNLEAMALGKVAEAADAIAEAASAGEVIRAIHAVAGLLFPVDSAAVAGEAPNPNPAVPILHLSIVPLGGLTRFVRVRSTPCRYCRGTLQEPGEAYLRHLF